VTFRFLFWITYFPYKLPVYNMREFDGLGCASAARRDRKRVRKGFLFRREPSGSAHRIYRLFILMLLMFTPTVDSSWW